jgi:ABC-type transporter Mla subunit MlaD
MPENPVQQQPFRMRHLNAMVGGFVLLTIMTLIGLTIAVAHGRNLFESTFVVVALFSDNSTGLIKPGTAVQIRSTEAGEVIDTRLQDAYVRVEMRIRESFHEAVRKDSNVILRTPTMGWGQTYIEIEQGTDERLASEGDVLPTKPQPSVIDQAQELIGSLKDEATPTLQQVQQLTHNIIVLLEAINDEDMVRRTGLFMDEMTEMSSTANDVKFVATVNELLAQHARLTERLNRDDQLARTLDNLNQTLLESRRAATETQRLLKRIDGELQRGEGLAGRMLSDPKLADDVTQALAEMRETAAEAKATAQEVRRTSEKFGPLMDRIDRTTTSVDVAAREMAIMAPEIPGLAYNMDLLFFDAQVLVDAMLRTWPFSNNVVPEEAGILPATGIIDSAPKAHVEETERLLESMPVPEESRQDDANRAQRVSNEPGDGAGQGEGTQ